MMISWRLVENNEEIAFTLVYNVYLGTKKFLVNNMEVLKLKNSNKTTEVNLIYNGNSYMINLLAEGYGYTGSILTPLGECIHPYVKIINPIKTPIWMFPLIILNFGVPVIALEALSPWLLALLASVISVKISKQSALTLVTRVCISISFTVLLWLLFIFYISH